MSQLLITPNPDTGTLLVSVPARVGPHPYFQGRKLIMSRTCHHGGRIYLAFVRRDAPVLEVWDITQGRMLAYIQDQQRLSFSSAVITLAVGDGVAAVGLSAPGAFCACSFPLPQGGDVVHREQAALWDIPGARSGVVLYAKPVACNSGLPGAPFLPGVLTGVDRIEALHPISISWFSAASPGEPVVVFEDGQGRLFLAAPQNNWTKQISGPVEASLTPGPLPLPQDYFLVGGITDEGGATLIFANQGGQIRTFRAGLCLAPLEVVDITPSPNPLYDSPQRRAGIVDGVYPDSYAQENNVGWNIPAVNQEITVRIKLRYTGPGAVVYGLLWYSVGNYGVDYTPDDVSLFLPGATPMGRTTFRDSALAGTWGVAMVNPTPIEAGAVFEVEARKRRTAWNDDWLFAGEVALLVAPASGGVVVGV